MKLFTVVTLLSILACTTSPRSDVRPPAAPDTTVVDTAKGEHHEHGEKHGKEKQRGDEKDKHEH